MLRFLIKSCFLSCSHQNHFQFALWIQWFMPYIMWVISSWYISLFCYFWVFGRGSSATEQFRHMQSRSSQVPENKVNEAYYQVQQSLRHERRWRWRWPWFITVHQYSLVGKICSNHRSGQHIDIYIPCRVGLVVSVPASHTVGCKFASWSGHTKDHHKNGTNCLPAWHAMR